ncbi:unnamed protein product [Microthlaspi erraticum]|uniref:Uncharacterized protein n=1 Tax=Microthlaspi erraticum TaxID=1685480 RepID=A0A6D2J7U6_9BRAS|nr:unnamed protein product [Microthlaspi erraticum]
MQSLRSVITQGTRGGRWVASRRSFSSSSAGEGGAFKADKIASATETNGAGDRAPEIGSPKESYHALYKKAVGIIYVASGAVLLYKAFVHEELKGLFKTK